MAEFVEGYVRYIAFLNKPTKLTVQRGRRTTKIFPFSHFFYNMRGKRNESVSGICFWRFNNNIIVFVVDSGFVHGDTYICDIIGS